MFFYDEASSMSIGTNEPEHFNDVPEWKCMSLEEINKGLGVYEFQEHPPIVASSCHTVLFMVQFYTHIIILFNKLLNTIV